MTAQSILDELATLGKESTKKVLMKHGAKEPFYGVKVEDLKKIQKRIKKNHVLSLDLYDTGNSDAMYLAGLIADEKQISKADLQHWVEGAYWYYLSEFTVPWVASESQFGWELAMEWIESEQENIASAGWATFSNLATIKEDKDLDIETLSNLLDRIKQEIALAPNRVRHTMNGFVISIGSHIPALTEKAKKIGTEIGKVYVDMGGTACKVPYSVEYIEKIEKMGKIGKKKKMARC